MIETHHRLLVQQLRDQTERTGVYTLRSHQQRQAIEALLAYADGLAAVAKELSEEQERAREALALVDELLERIG